VNEQRPRDVVRSLLALGVALVAPLVSSCGEFSARGVQLRQDDSITFDTPADQANVATPFELSWTDGDRPAGTRYAVVINRVPMPPGEGLDWFVGDDECDRRTDCPTDDELRLRGVIVTDEPTVDVAVVPSVIGGRDGGDDEFTVIRIDAGGRRVSEAAFLRRLEVGRGSGL
jgi:hypothetical protein